MLCSHVIRCKRGRDQFMIMKRKRLIDLALQGAPEQDASSSDHVAGLFLPNSLRTKAVRATTPMMTNFFAPRSRTQSPLKSPSFAATPPATRAAIPYDATLSPDASLKSA